MERRRRRTILRLVILSVMAVTIVSAPLGSIASLSGVATSPAAEAGHPTEAALSVTCMIPICDVNRNGIIDIVDIMLVASKWQQEGAWTSDLPQNVVVVAKSGGDHTSIQDALDSITDASASNPYLVWVAPGTYTETVTMKQYVDIEGAGELVTKITYTESGYDDTITVVGADNAELRFLTVENTGGGADAIAIHNDSASPRLTHVTAIASGAGGTARMNIGVRNVNTSSPTMTNVTATGFGGAITSSCGVLNEASSPTMTEVTATASGGGFGSTGVCNYEASSPTMTNVTASASGGTYDNYGVYNDEASSPTMTDVTASASGGNSTCGVYNDNSSPTMTNVTASASGGTYENIGVYNGHSSPTMTNVTATALGGEENYGVFNVSCSPTIIMTNVTATASGGTDSYGVYNGSSSLTIQNSVISGSGGTNNYGLYSLAIGGSYTVTVDASEIRGSTNTIYRDGHFTTLVGASLLDGGEVTGTGTIVYASVYDESYTLISVADPPCFDNENRYVDCGNGTVHDTVTNLIWLKNANCFGELDYAAANNAAVGLEDGECGLTDGSSPGDWRLPTEEEWQATIERAVELGCTDNSDPASRSLTNTPGDDCYSAGPKPFFGVRGYYYWSSTASAYLPYLAYTAHLGFGYVHGDSVKQADFIHFVWPVRGGQ